MFLQLFLGIVFLVTGVICLGSGLFQHVAEYNRWAMMQVSVQQTLHNQTAAHREGFQHHDKWLRGLERDLKKLQVDVGENKGELAHKQNELAKFVHEGLYPRLQANEAKTQKIGDDLYRHFSLNMKKRGGK